MCNFHWFAADFYAHSHFLPLSCFSDHSACVVTTFQQESRINRSFKFFSIWSSHEDFLPIVNAEWNKGIQGMHQFILCSKLKALKGPLKQLNKLHFSHIGSRAEFATESLKSALTQLQMDPSNS